jgi:hypothetical protein
MILDESMTADQMKKAIEGYAEPYLPGGRWSQPDFDRSISVDDFETVVDICLALSLAVYKDRPCGHFCTAVLKDQLRESFNRADDTNRRNIWFYVMFIYNHLPAASYSEEIRARLCACRGCSKPAEKDDPAGRFCAVCFDGECAH